MKLSPLKKLKRKLKLSQSTIWRHLRGHAKENRQGSKSQGDRIRAEARRLKFLPRRLCVPHKAVGVIVPVAIGRLSQLSGSTCLAMAVSQAIAGRGWHSVLLATDTSKWTADRSALKKASARYGLKAAIVVGPPPMPTDRPIVACGWHEDADVKIDETSGMELLHIELRRRQRTRTGWVDLGWTDRTEADARLTAFQAVFGTARERRSSRRKRASRPMDGVAGCLRWLDANKGTVDSVVCCTVREAACMVAAIGIRGFDVVPATVGATPASEIIGETVLTALTPIDVAANRVVKRLVRQLSSGGRAGSESVHYASLSDGLKSIR